MADQIKIETSVTASLHPQNVQALADYDSDTRGELGQPVAEYQKAVRVAEGFIRRVRPPRPITLKVLSVTGAEASTMMQIDPATLFADQTPEEEAQLRGLVVARCKDALRDNNDPAVRNDAYDLLINLGELK